LIIEKNTNTVVAQLIAKAVLVRIIHPFTNPINRNRCWVLGIISSREEGTRYQKDFNEFEKLGKQVKAGCKLAVKLGEVAV